MLKAIALYRGTSTAYQLSQGIWRSRDGHVAAASPAMMPGDGRDIIIKTMAADFSISPRALSQNWPVNSRPPPRRRVFTLYSLYRG